MGPKSLPCRKYLVGDMPSAPGAWQSSCDRVTRAGAYGVLSSDFRYTSSRRKPREHGQTNTMKDDTPLVCLRGLKAHVAECISAGEVRTSSGRDFNSPSCRCQNMLKIINAEMDINVFPPIITVTPNPFYQ